MRDEMATPAPPSDATLARYLLGALPPDEEQRLDELSIADNDFAERLRAVEHDLADAYARGELNAADRRRWEERYLVSAEGRQQLRLAQALAAREARTMPASRARTFRWSLAAAALIVLAAVTGYLVTHRQPVEQARVGGTAPPNPAQALPQAAPPAPAPQTKAEPRFVAMTLLPPTRSISETPTLTIPGGSEEVRLTLKLEPNDATRYQIAVRDLAATATVWRSGIVDATTTETGKAIELTLPAGIFRLKAEATRPRAKRYLINVRSVSPRGSEIVGSYLLRIVLE
jgi:hypothetical protein